MLLEPHTDKIDRKFLSRLRKLEFRAQAAPGAGGHHARRGRAHSGARPAAAQIHRAGGVQRPPAGQAESAAQRDSGSSGRVRPAAVADARSADSGRARQFSVGARAAAFLRHPDAEQRLLSGPRGGNAGFLRAVPHRAGIAQSGGAAAPVPRIAGARVPRRCRPAVHAERGIDRRGCSRRAAQVGASFPFPTSPG